MLVYMLNNLLKKRNIYYIYLNYLNIFVNQHQLQEIEYIKTDNNYSSIRFTTRQLSCFTQLHELFYVDKVKIFTQVSGCTADPNQGQGAAPGY